MRMVDWLASDDRLDMKACVLEYDKNVVEGKKIAENGRNQIGKRQSDGSVWQLSDEEGLRLRKQAHSILAMLNGRMPCLSSICIWISGAKGNKSS
uniref:Uncharacterized protein n=1 Tax=Ditylenchus dipsaci TaxID=166011 RepID=A0A915E7G2_9BILA